MVGTETLSDHITFTTIHMPLVRTPMIAPSRRLNPMPADQPPNTPRPWWCAGWWTSPPGSTPRSARWPTPGTYFTPKLSRRVLHQLYLGYPDSAAARGDGRELPSPAADPVGTGARSAPADASRRPRASDSRVPRPVKRAVRLVPGVHW